MHDEEGVGGFFEDLPVLAFVLLGVFVLVTAGIVASRAVSERREAESLACAAESILTAVTSHLLSPNGVGGTLTAAAMRQMDLRAISDNVSCCDGYCVSVVMLHPLTEWLASATVGNPHVAILTGFCQRFMNAACDGGSIGIVEVRVLAW